MSNLELPSSKKQEMFVGVGDDGAACEKLELKQKSRFSLHLHSIIDRIVPKFCRDEFCSGDMDDTFSVSSFEDSSESALLNPIHPEALAEDEDAMDTKVEKEKVPSPTPMMQSRTTKRRSISRSPHLREHKKILSHKK